MVSWPAPSTSSALWTNSSRNLLPWWTRLAIRPSGRTHRNTKSVLRETCSWHLRPPSLHASGHPKGTTHRDRHPQRLYSASLQEIQHPNANPRHYCRAYQRTGGCTLTETSTPMRRWEWMIAGKTIFIHKRKERPYVQIQWAYGRSFLYCLWRIHTEESLCLA